MTPTLNSHRPKICLEETPGTLPPDEKAWTLQEKLKGSFWIGFTSETHGGWGRNPAHNSIVILLCVFPQSIIAGEAFNLGLKVNVTHENGSPISNAIVRVGFGQNRGLDSTLIHEGKSGEDGLFVVSEKLSGPLARR